MFASVNRKEPRRLQQSIMKMRFKKTISVLGKDARKHVAKVSLKVTVCCADSIPFRGFAANANDRINPYHGMLRIVFGFFSFLSLLIVSLHP